MVLPWMLGATLASGLAAPLHDSGCDDPDFAREVLPILSDKCFLCHGPDATSREAGLRLDLEDDARRSGVLESVAGGPAELVARILEDDPEWRMPPPEAKHALTEAERATLVAWVQAGAPYALHWAFEALPAAVEAPPDGDGWARSPLDRFVARAHARAGVTPAPPASDERWLRRVTLDLTGLPPTPEEVRAFLGGGAREPVVERLLASPRFGVRMATPWLDVARYADSWGYQSDQLNTLWPWRDWVVRALNGNLPYDEFLTWQLAGDLLPDATEDQRLATAFQRVHRMTNEGGSVEAEWRDASIVDRVETFGAAMLGLTLGCARCHDHKYDPISQRDFYGLYAYFNSIDEWGLYNDSARIPSPSMLLPRDDGQRAELERRGRAVEDAARAVRDAGGAGPFLAADEPRAEYVAREGAPRVLDGDGALRIDGVGRLGPTDAFAVELSISIPEGIDDAIVLHQTAGTDVGYHGFELRLVDGRLHARHTRFWPGNALAIESVAPVPRGRFVEVVYAQHGDGRAAGMSLVVDGESETRIVRDGLTKLPGGPAGWLDVGARFRDRGLAGSLVQSVRIRDAGQRSAPLDALCAARHAELEFATGVHEVPIMREAADAPRPAFALARGAYDAPRGAANRVERAVPAVFRAGAAAVPSRLELARWLTAPDHPLTARIAVNRLWQTLFGTGLVATPDDFGLQGATPTHPELLDWLARRFVDSGWDTKALIAEIVLSATYAQDSRVAPDARAADPENQLLARGPARRMSAEMLRDSALFAAGLLDERVGGPPVSPYQPPGLWREANSMSPAYRQSVGADLHRRSIQSVVKRTAPLPNMGAFDAPMRETSCARREDTTTPLQGLVLQGDVQFVEAARVLAARSWRAAEGRADDALADAYLRLTGRVADGGTLAILGELFAGELAAFEADPEGAAALIAAGESEAPTDIEPATLAAATVTVQAILCLDATVMVR